MIPLQARQGALSPEALAVLVRATDTAVDLSTATGATFAVRKPSGVSATWAATMSGATATAVTVTHLYASGDLDEVGDYVVVATLSFLGGGVVKDTPRSLSVFDSFDPGPGSGC